MSSKLFGILFLYFVIFLLLNILYTGWLILPLGNTTNEMVNLIEKSEFQNKLSKVVNITCASKSKFYKDCNEYGTTRSSTWCDSCINYYKYKALIHPKHIPDTNLDMVIFIPSQHGDTSFQRRQFLRKFPLNSTNFTEVKIRHVFVFGKFSTFYFLDSFGTSRQEPQSNVNLTLNEPALRHIIW